MPNFLIIGAPRSGTTSLHAYLAQHPQVFMSPVKEPMFFAFPEDAAARALAIREIPAGLLEHVVLDIEAYRKLFEGVRAELAVGEASASYLVAPRAAARIQGHLPTVRLIALLREPVERAHSEYCWRRAMGIEALPDFDEAVQAEIADGRPTHYVWNGLYSRHLAQYYERFDRGQLKVLLFDDFARDPLAVCAEVCRFLGVDDTFRPDVSRRLNRAGIPRDRVLGRLPGGGLIGPALGRCAPDALLRRLADDRDARIDFGDRQDVIRPRVSPPARRRLAEAYRDEIARLQDLIGRDLSAWRRIAG